MMKTTIIGSGKKVSEKDDKIASVKERSNGKGKSAEAKAPTVEQVKKSIEAEINRFNRKAELIAHREQFQATKEELVGYLGEQGSDFDDTLDSEHLRIHLYDDRKYSNDRKIVLKNNMMVREFIVYLVKEINNKVMDIEKEILV